MVAYHVAEVVRILRWGYGNLHEISLGLRLVSERCTPTAAWEPPEQTSRPVGTHVSKARGSIPQNVTIYGRDLRLIAHCKGLAALVLHIESRGCGTSIPQIIACE
jgi:hypothetical protein